MQLTRALRAIGRATTALAKKGPSGIPALQSAAQKGPRFKQLDRIRTALVIKRKSTNVFKPRLRLSGDLEKPDIPLSVA